MNIWLRKPGTTDFLGPFTREAALTQLAAGTITIDYEVLEATGQTFGALKRSTDWSPVSSVFSAEEISSVRASSVVARAATSAIPSGSPAAKVMSRYRDAYLVARTIVGVGSIIKGIGIFIAIVIALVGLVAATQGQSNFIMGLGGVLLGVVVGVPLFVLGILVSAQGQILKATLDVAVNDSPFLSDDQRAEMMSLT